MFSITDSDLPDHSPLNLSAIAGITDAEMFPGYAITGLYQSNGQLEGFVTVPSFDDKITVTLIDIGAVTNVRIGKQNYTFNSALTPGTYTYNSQTQQLTIKPFGSVKTGQPIVYQAIELKVPVRSTQILQSLPLFLKAWNCYGQIRLQRNFERHPTGSLSFLTNDTNETTIKNFFSPENTLILYGISYRTSGYTITHYPQSRKIKAEINLVGIHSPRGERNPLDRPIKLKQFAGKTITINQLSSEINYSGPSITLPIEKNISEDTTTTFRRELETRAGIVGGFLDYTGHIPNVKVFGSTATHFLSPADVLQKEWSITYQGQGANYTGVPLYAEIHNIKLKLDKLEDQENEEITLFEGDPNPQIAPNIDKKQFRSNALAFDLGGPTKTQRKVKMLNSTTTRETLSVWGFVYTEADTHVVSEVTRLENPGDSNSLITTFDIRFAEPTFDNYWQQIKHLTIDHIFNSNTGEYEASPGVGWELMRFLKSNENLEICQLQGAKLITDDVTEQAKIQQIIDKYQFFRNPVNSSTDIELELFGNHYKDITQTDKPKFAKVLRKTEDSFATIPDPRTGENNETRPPLIAGSRKTQEMRRTIAPTKIEVYKETETVTNAQGTDLSQTAQSQTYRDIKGRPPVQPRLEKYPRSTEGKAPDSPEIVYRLNTPGSLNLSSNQLFSIPSGVTNLDTALKFVQTQISKENTENAVNLKLKTIRHPEWNLGDILIFSGVSWVILFIDETQLIRHNTVWYYPVEISLGMLLQPTVSATVDKN